MDPVKAEIRHRISERDKLVTELASLQAELQGGELIQLAEEKPRIRLRRH